MEVSIDARDLERLIKKLEAAPDILRDARRRAMEEATLKLKQEVDTAIGGEGKVQGWQEKYVGSKGGYAAVRPKAKTFTKVNGRGKKYAVGYVTNAIEHGHRFPSTHGKQRRYNEIRNGQLNVPGRHFYQEVNKKIPEIAQEAAAQVEAELIAHLED